MRNNDIKFKTLPASLEEVRERGWDKLDVILFSGDAYVDHPSFGPAIIARLLESEGLRVAVIPQPNWRDDLRDFKKLGEPELFFGVSAGNMDSMVNHYTANKRLRSDDAYTPGGRAGYRPDYPSIVYSKILKELYPDTPIVLGGVEASMRRLAHYDYWNNSVEPSVLLSSGADMLIYGMAEKPIIELTRLLKKGVPLYSISSLAQSVIKVKSDKPIPRQKLWDTIEVPSFDEVKKDKEKFSEAFVVFEKESNRLKAARIVQSHGEDTIIANPPALLMSTDETDRIYDLPYTRLPHPRYRKKPPIPAYEMIKNSINMHRGCFGGCSFCAIAAHQGKHIVSRSKESISREVDRIVSQTGFNGVITDIGGPSANMYMMHGVDLNLCQRCSRPSCIWPSICNNLNTSHKELVDLYAMIRRKEGLKHFFVTSGIRYDMLSKGYNKKAGKPEEDYLRDIIRYHVSGRFKVAPEHTSSNVLKVMRKTSFNYFVELVGKFRILTKKYNLNYEIIPYFISSHPGCTLENMGELAAETKKLDLRLEQVQDFTPTPMTMATTIFYTGKDPYTGEKMFVAYTDKERKSQSRMFFWYKTENEKAIKNDLTKFHRMDLIKKIFSKVQDSSHKTQGGKIKKGNRRTETGNRRTETGNRKTETRNRNTRKRK